MNDNTTHPSPQPSAAAAAFALAVFGRDDGGKPHASRFTASDAALAERAAGLMGMQVLRLETSEQQELCANLPAGRVFESGRAFVPFVKGALFERLVATSGAFTPARPPDAEVPAAAPRKAQGGRSVQRAADLNESDPTGATSPGAPPTERASIKVGHVVLAAEENAPEVWYLATVTTLKGEHLLQLRWTGAEWSDEPPFVRHREHLALLPPAVALTLK